PGGPGPWRVAASRAPDLRRLCRLPATAPAPAEDDPRGVRGIPRTRDQHADSGVSPRALQEPALPATVMPGTPVCSGRAPGRRPCSVVECGPGQVFRFARGAQHVVLDAD